MSHEESNLYEFNNIIFKYKLADKQALFVSCIDFYIKSIWVNFWPKINLRPVLGWRRSLFGPQIFQNKLTTAHTLWPCLRMRRTSERTNQNWVLTLKTSPDLKKTRKQLLRRLSLLGWIFGPSSLGPIPGPIPENVTPEEAHQKHQEDLIRMLQNIGQTLEKQNAQFDQHFGLR